MEAPASDVEAVGWRALLRGGQAGTLVVLCLGIWLHAADSVMIATILPSIVAEIGGVAWVGWPFVIYGLGSIMAASTAAMLTRALGLGTAMALAAGLYGMGAAISASASSIGWIITGSAFQGVGGGWMMALSFVAATRLFAKAQWPLVLAILSSVWGISALCGPLVGGLFAEYGSWRGAYWAFLGQALVVGAAGWRLGAPDGGSENDAGPVRPPLGRLASLGAGVLAIAEAGLDPSPIRATATVAAGIALLGLFLALEARAGETMLPRNPLDIRRPVGAGLVMVLSLAMATISLTAYGPFLMQHLHNASPLVAGYVVASESVSWTFAAIAAARAPQRAEPSLIIGGAVAIATGVAGFAWAMPRGPLLVLVPFGMLQGIGFGLAWTFIVKRVVGALPEGEQARATAAMPTLQLLGYSLGAAVAGIIANSGGLVEGASEPVLRAVAFWLFAAFLPVAGLGILAAVRLSRAPV